MNDTDEESVDDVDPLFGASPSMSPESASRKNTKRPYKFKCPFKGCSRSFTSRSGRSSHKNREHLNRKPFRCEICNEHFYSSSTRVAHIRREHVAQEEYIVKYDEDKGGKEDGGSKSKSSGGEKGSKSNETSKSSKEMTAAETTAEKKGVSRHPVYPRGAKPQIEMPPEIVEEMMARQIDGYGHTHLLTNLECKAFDESYECMECTARFEFSDDLLQHLNNHKYFEEDFEQECTRKPDVCVMCEFVAWGADEEEKSQRMADHVIVEHFKAELPPDVLEPPEDARKTAKKKIKEREAAENKFHCHVCARCFNFEYQKDVHLRYNHLDSVTRDTALMKGYIKCAKCKTKCKDEEQLKLHQFLYCDVCYMCEECDERFPRVNLLVQHVRLKHLKKTTSIDKPNEEDDSEDMDELKIDEDVEEEQPDVIPEATIKVEDAETVADADTVITYSCPVCKMDIDSDEVLVKHLKNQHGNKKQLKCDMCDYVADNIHPFVAHYMKHVEACS